MLGGWPLIAEIVSGARFGRNLVHGYRRLLADPSLGGRVERAVVLGHPTLSRESSAVLSDPDVEVLAVRGPGRAAQPQRVDDRRRRGRRGTGRG